ncbi:DNA-directed RNA polymerase III subunit RPC5-like [Salvia splendens]|uniref:DNA-directed RNA polymerase III subunit RPC5-like n=1 Tax=Salvia splendens TaxID=180675 RepID=UPI001C26EEEB|nr:DNA-directed RNA polymerase III subunit RPC5-like [Salvia splendens]
MDLDDLDDGPKQASTRASRFAPKGAKFQPKPKPKAEPPSSSASLSLPPPKKEELDVKPDIKPYIKPEHDDNGAAKMEVDDEPEDTEFRDGDEDEVVREFDVYFSPSIDIETQLYLLQYPLRQPWRPYELDLDGRCQEVRVKQASREVEIDLAIDVDSANYDNDADPQIQMKKQTIATSWIPHRTQTNGYTIAELTGNKLHLNRIHAAVQLRPLMHHISVVESKKKTAVSKNVEDVVKLEKPQEAKPSGTSKKLKAPEQTNGSVEESWIQLKYHNTMSDITAGYLQKMMERKGSEISLSMSLDNYLNSLCPGISGGGLRSKVPQKRSLLAKPLKEQFKTWLLEDPHQLHRFGTLRRLAPDEPIEEVLAVLQEVALLVQGLWIIRTSLCREIGNSDVRNYVLFLFSKDVIIRNDQILNKKAGWSEAVKQFLRNLARERHTFGHWKLKELPDSKFMELYPAIVKKQQEQWDCMEKRFDQDKKRHVVKTPKSGT